MYMKYCVNDNRIVITGLEEFSIKQILECGQIFRYKRISDSNYEVFFGNHHAIICENRAENRAEIVSDDAIAAIRFFDLDNSYFQAKETIKKVPGMKEAVEAGYGIRILKGDPSEIIFSFIISANNNIKRIQGIIEKLVMLGDNMGDYRAFPTALQIMSASDEFMDSLHAGYRKDYLKKTAKMLLNVDLNEKAKLPSSELKKWLMTLSGVGPKVASCIMLFGFGRQDCFPVDTWINKVYHNYFFAGEKTRPEIERYFLQVFGDTMSGIAQQYLFYYYKK